MKKKIIFILGPTSSGKSLLAIKLAKHINGEIISSDSIQIYKHMNILSGKINFKDREGILHHMIDIIDPCEEFSVFKYFSMTKKILSNIFNKNKIPIITGGTGLYSKVIMNNKIKPQNYDINKRIKIIHQIYGNKFLFQWLSSLNYDKAIKISHYNNVQRVIRALEIFYDNIHIKNNENNLNKDIFFDNIDFINFILMPNNREELYKKINFRVNVMIEQGLLIEVQNLISNFNVSQTSKQAIGYKELISYFQNKDSLSNCINNIKIKSRNYAKRQITWFKKQENSNFIYYNVNDSIKYLLKKIIDVINKEVT